MLCFAAMATHAPRDIPEYVRAWLRARVDADGLWEVRQTLGGTSENAIAHALAGLPVAPGTVASIALAYIRDKEGRAA